MLLRRSILYLIITLFLSLGYTIKTFAIKEEDNGIACNYLFNAYLLETKKGGSQESHFYRECESCCQLLENDSLLVELYLMDTLNLYIDSVLFSTIKLVNERKENSSTEVLAEAYSKGGFIHSEKKPDIAIAEIKKSYFYYSRAKDLKNQAIALQNIAFIFDEKKNQYGFAVQYSIEALKKMKELKDTLSTANLLKYIGFLYGKLNNPVAGIEYVSRAIVLFQTQKFEKGVAVSYFDMAMIYRENKDYKTQEQYLTKAKNIWRPYHEIGRIFLINNSLLESYSQLGKKGDLKKIIDENRQLIEKDNDNIIKEKDKIIFLNLVKNLSGRMDQK